MYKIFRKQIDNCVVVYAPDVELDHVTMLGWAMLQPNISTLSILAKDGYSIYNF